MKSAGSRKPNRDVEREQVERKQTFDPREVARQISAMANAEGGLIVVGVTSDGSVVGLGSQIGTVRERLSKSQSKVVTSGTALFRSRAVTTSFSMWVPRISDRVVCLSDGRAYQRRGSNTVELSTAEILELRDGRVEQLLLVSDDRSILEALLAPGVAKLKISAVLSSTVFEPLR